MQPLMKFPLPYDGRPPPAKLAPTVQTHGENRLWSGSRPIEYPQGARKASEHSLSEYRKMQTQPTAPQLQQSRAYSHARGSSVPSVPASGGYSTRPQQTQTHGLQTNLPASYEQPRTYIGPIPCPPPITCTQPIYLTDEHRPAVNIKARAPASAPACCYDLTSSSSYPPRHEPKTYDAGPASMPGSYPGAPPICYDNSVGNNTHPKVHRTCDQGFRSTAQVRLSRPSTDSLRPTETYNQQARQRHLATKLATSSPESTLGNSSQSLRRKVSFTPSTFDPAGKRDKAQAQPSYSLTRVVQPSQPQGPSFQPNVLPVSASARWAMPALQPKPKPRPLPILIPHEPRPQPIVQSQTQSQVYQSPRTAPAYVASHTSGRRPPRRRALLVGIRYVGTKAELRGPWNDLTRMYWYIAKDCPEPQRYPREEIVVLKDDPKSDERAQPTRYNIEAAMDWLVSDAQAGDSFFFHFCGHGSHFRQGPGRTMHETIVPIDYASQGLISDEDMYCRIVAHLPAGCKMMCIMDCCHSGNMLSLPYLYPLVGKAEKPTVVGAKVVSEQFTKVLRAYEKNDLDGVARDMLDLLEGARQEDQRAKFVSSRRPKALVTVLSSCKDDEKASDLNYGGVSSGALTTTLLEALMENPRQSYSIVLTGLRDRLVLQHRQTPQLACSHLIPDLMSRTFTI